MLGAWQYHGTLQLQWHALRCCFVLPHCSPLKTIILLLVHRNLAGNSGLCNPASGRQLPYALPVCDDQTLQAQQQADPAAVAGAVSQPALISTTPPGPLTPGSDSNQSSDSARLVVPFLAVAAAGVLVCCLMAAGRKRGQVCSACFSCRSALHVHLGDTLMIFRLLP